MVCRFQIWAQKFALGHGIFLCIHLKTKAWLSDLAELEDLGFVLRENVGVLSVRVFFI
jgi:hypothetical protein